VRGYEREMFTHTAVAAAVSGGTANTGLGVLAAARALGLEFMPLGRERYDLLVLRSFEGSPGHRTLVRVLSDTEYRGEVEALGGYDLGEAGRIISLEGSR
ncbi:MAG: molybdopterin biosynthesis protein, partial [Actinobacteria bacterium]|nr:molybdopterin biosynthesis protein [Actinomycetota bacterium]